MSSGFVTGLRKILLLSAANRAAVAGVNVLVLMALIFNAPVFDEVAATAAALVPEITFWFPLVAIVVDAVAADPPSTDGVGSREEAGTGVAPGVKLELFVLMSLVVELVLLLLIVSLVRYLVALIVL